MPAFKFGYSPIIKQIVIMKKKINDIKNIFHISIAMKCYIFKLDIFLSFKNKHINNKT